MTRSILVRAAKGGVGKSTLAIALENMLSLKGMKFHLVDADHDETKQHADGKAGASLASVFGDRVETVRIGATVEALERDVNSAYTHWFPLFKTMRDRDVLADFGANTMGAVDAALEGGGWASSFQKAGTQIDVVIPLTTHPEAMENGLAAIASTQRVLPNATIVVALVEKDGPFAAYKAHPHFKELMTLVEGGVQVISVPRCTSILWQAMELAHLDFNTATERAKADPDELATFLKLEPEEVNLGLLKLAPWFKAVRAECERVGLLRPPAPAAKIKASA